MLSTLNISNVALIDELQVEFEPGLNLLTGETGSGKSIIVDALGVLIGGKFPAEMIKAGESRASVEGQFSVERHPELEKMLQSAGIEVEDGPECDVLIRRELAANGRSRIFINHQLATQSLLRELRPFLVDIHGQGDQQTLFNPDLHLDMLDIHGGLSPARQDVAALYRSWSVLRDELDRHRRDEAEKFQLVDILRFQIGELEQAGLVLGEDERLEEERRRLTNVEKLTALCKESFDLTYEDGDSAIARIRQASRRVEELGEFEPSFRAYQEGLESARAVLEDLAFALRDFGDRLEYSPDRLAGIEDRFVEVARLKRKYGGTIETALEHLARSQDRLRNIEHADEREAELRVRADAARAAYLAAAWALHRERIDAAKAIERDVETDLREVAMESARFEVRIASPPASDFNSDDAARACTARGIDRVEFYFSANPGEGVRPLAKVASGGEASRLMLVLKTAASASEFPRTIVFDEIDTGIGGRVAEAVGAKLRRLSKTNQVFCVTHQPQIARFGDVHLLVRKEAANGRTHVVIDKLDKRGRVEEIARMLTGSDITDTARRHARELLKTI